ncbi:MAG: tRNA lysidine(34) synthetase TilS [Cytophagales bacterium]|nr:MAG: tRNA lysidine(34) synthetase TilS [Cytophagales bacterium]
MLGRFKSYILKNRLCKANDQLLVAVSGGIDSVVLCKLLKDAKVNFAIAHCNFALRGKESDEDELFVRQLANEYHVPIYTKKFDTNLYSEIHKVSIQMAARTLRYSWFEEIAQLNHYDLIATAHHLNDSLETSILNLTKGTGIAGLRGILPLRDNIIRPLLFASKQEIIDFALASQLAWREDVSNSSDKYQRNLIRNKVMPLLKEINPNIEQTFSETSDRIQSVELIFQTYFLQIKSSIVSYEGDTIVLNLQQDIPIQGFKAIIFELIKPFGYAWAQVEEILKPSINGVRKFYAHNYLLLKYAHEIRITKVSQEKQEAIYLSSEDSSVENNYFRLELSIIGSENLVIDKNSSVIYLDASIIEFPLCVRRWQEGDRFIPFGMNGQKKISDYLIDAKIRLDQKEKIYLLTSGSDILWVLGKRASNLARINSLTKSILRIEFVPLKS